MKYHDCICYRCNEHKRCINGLAWDCACESGPVYDAEACGQYCPYRYVCDVALKPSEYPHNDNDDLKSILEDAGYEVAVGLSAIQTMITSVAEESERLCSGFGVFPGGERCLGCADCKQPKR